MTFLEKLAEKKVLVSDGAWGTELVKKGFGTDTCPELLNVDHPDVLHDIAESYVKAGSDIILTNTFGGNPFKLSRYGVGDRLEELNKAGVRITKEAAAGLAFTFASIGPTGEFLEPLGPTTMDEMTEAFSKQVRVFVEEGADGIIIESMTDLGEITCALRAVKKHSDYPVVCSMTFDKGLKGYATIMGVKPEDAVRTLEDEGTDVVGSNCGWGIVEMIDVARIMRPVTGLPLWVKPNAGIPELVDGETVYRHTPDFMAHHIPKLFEIGVSFVGGCCGSTPEHIRKIRDMVDAVVS